MSLSDWVLGKQPRRERPSGARTDSKLGRAYRVLTEWKWPITVMLISGVIAWAAFDARVPSPPGWLFWTAVSAGIIAVPAYAFGAWLAKTVIARISVRVVELSGPKGDIQPWLIPPSTWKNREVAGIDAYRPDDSETWYVWNLDWNDDLERMEVFGVWPEIADPLDVWKSDVRADAMFHDMLKELIKSHTVVALVGKRAVDIHDDAIAEWLLFEELGILPDGVEVTKHIDALESEIDGTLDIESIGEFGADGSGNDRLDAAVSEGVDAAVDAFESPQAHAEAGGDG